MNSIIAFLQYSLLLADNFFPFDRLHRSKDRSKQRALRQENKKFPCPNCKSAYTRKDNLQKHLNYECGQQPRFMCPYCPYLSKKTSNVRTHIRKFHIGSVVYVTDLNASDFRGFETPFDPEISPSSAIRKFPCPNCKSAFSRKNNLYSHLKLECGLPPCFFCPYCEYSSKKSSNIRAHVRRKHNGCEVNVIRKITTQKILSS